MGYASGFSDLFIFRNSISTIFAINALLLLLVSFIADAQQTGCSELEELICQDSPIGAFIVVDVRKASGVASTLNLSDYDEVIGEAIEFGLQSLSMAGITCDEWAVRSIDMPGDLADPLLGDTMIGPIDGDTSSGDRRVLKGWQYSCEGEAFLDLLQIDARVMVIPWANSTVNLILERPLSSLEVSNIQAALSDLKFHSGDLSGKLDKATLHAIGLWAEYRSTLDEPYRFARTAITENLFDGLDVFEKIKP